jgi:hypothetical protein
LRTRRILAAAAAAASIGITAAACGVAVEPSVGQYAFVTGHGALSNQQVNAVYGPGARASAGNGSIIWYVPANQRNYITAQPGSLGDRTNPQTVSTDSGPGGAAKVPVKVYSFLSWELNPAIQDEKTPSNVSPMANAFFRFCLKYGCATQQSQQNASNSSLSHSSVPGWNNMLAENFPSAIDNATQAAISSFPPNVWNDQTQWPALGRAIQARIPAELRSFTGSGALNYFCGPGSTAAHCTPPLLTVKFVTPADPGAQAAYNQQVNANIQGQAAKTRLSTARKLYGPLANWVLAETDILNQCGDHCPNTAWIQPGTIPGK